MPYFVLKIYEMNLGFWGKLNKEKKCITASAPMAGVTDAAFRAMLAEYGKPSSAKATEGKSDAIWTEMISADGVKHRGEEAFEAETMFSQAERPIIMQIFGGDPDNVRLTAEMARKKGFDGIDINMGCPDANVEKQGAGACLIKNPETARKVISALKEGAGEIPISVKTRLGYSEKRETDEWIGMIANEGPAAITIHGRTRNEKRKGEADFEAVGEAAKLIKKINPEIIVLGNGDIKSVAEGEEKCHKYGLDGYMVGRALIGNPWFFAGIMATGEERITAAIRHTEIFRELLEGKKSFDTLKTHYGEYMSGFAGAKEIRSELMNAKNIEEAEKILNCKII
jgi:tRNA-dihydrouridine synthase B